MSFDNLCLRNRVGKLSILHMFLSGAGAMAGAMTPGNSREAVVAKCQIPMDVVFLQDATGSFVQDIPNVRQLLPDLLDSLSQTYEDLRFAVTSFKDKPYRWLGNTGDYCFKEHGVLSADKDIIIEQYEEIFVTAGGDWPEATLQAVVSLARSQTIGWRPVSEDIARVADGEVGARVIFLMTDAKPHDPDGYNNWNGEWFPEKVKEEDRPFIPPTSMKKWPTEDELRSFKVTDDELCVDYEYPTLEQTGLFLLPQKTYLLVATPSVNRIDEFINDIWIDKVTALGFPSEFVQTLTTESKNIALATTKAVSTFSDYLCSFLPTQLPVVTPTPGVSSTPPLPLSTGSVTTTVGMTTDPVTTTVSMVTTVPTTHIPIQDTKPVTELTKPTTTTVLTNYETTPAHIYTDWTDSPADAESTRPLTFPSGTTDLQDCPHIADEKVVIKFNKKAGDLNVNYVP